MALIEMGVIVTKIRGKSKGAVFTGNTSGNILRNKSIPYRHTSVARSNQNNFMKYLSQSWSNLSPTDQAAWATHSLNFTFYNKLGAAVAAAPNLVFNITNQYYYQIGHAILTSPLGYANPPTVNITGAAIDSGSHTASISFGTLSGSFYFPLFVSKPFSNGKGVFSQKNLAIIYQLYAAGGVTYTQSFDALFWRKYPATLPGQYVTIAFRTVHPTFYTWGPLQYITVLVT
jgi:hypothetical protein